MGFRGTGMRAVTIAAVVGLGCVGCSTGGGGGAGNPSIGSAVTTPSGASTTTLPSDFPADVPMPPLPLLQVTTASHQSGVSWMARYRVDGTMTEAVSKEGSLLAAQHFEPAGQSTGPAMGYVRSSTIVTLMDHAPELWIMVFVTA